MIQYRLNEKQLYKSLCLTRTFSIFNENIGEGRQNGIAL